MSKVCSLKRNQSTDTLTDHRAWKCNLHFQALWSARVYQSSRLPPTSWCQTFHAYHVLRELHLKKCLSQNGKMPPRPLMFRQMAHLKRQHQALRAISKIMITNDSPYWLTNVCEHQPLQWIQVTSEYDEKSKRQALLNKDLPKDLVWHKKRTWLTNYNFEEDRSWR